MEMLRKNTAFDILYYEAAKESADYIKKYRDEAIIADEGWWLIAVNKIKIKGLLLEFGVYKGKSLNFFSSQKPNHTWYGFDSFTGFQEDWKGGYFAKGMYSLKGIEPKMNNNVKLIKGLFKKTLPKFLKNTKDPVSFMHVDCDTYESTKEVLDILGPKRLVSNTRILFDEYTSYIGWKNGEFKAWQEFVKKHKVKYKYEMFGERQALIKIF
tara:strand:+ start:96 stop:728 length:633 start_codon:yes stop_codon:yes gene_type:complete